jgi:hypothetical protein
MPVKPPQPPQQDGEAIAKDVDLLARELERLRLSYEQYFLGLEKDEPIKLKLTVTRLISKLSGAAVQNARLKFRVQQTIARFNTFSTYWNRILKDIEEGRHRRDVFRATIHEKERFGKWKEEKAAGVAAKASEAAGGASDPMAALFEQYVDARKQTNESLAGLTLDAFKKSMNSQLTALKQKVPAGNFRFQVAVEGGKTKIKAIPQQPPKPAK